MNFILLVCAYNFKKVYEKHICLLFYPVLMKVVIFLMANSL